MLAMKWLPLLLCCLGSFSFHLMTDVLPGLMSAGPLIQEGIANVLGPLACVLTENTAVTKLNCVPSFEESVCENISVLCPNCDSDAVNGKGNLFFREARSCCFYYFCACAFTSELVSLYVQGNEEARFLKCI